MFRIKEVHETWFFQTAADAKEDDKNKSIGYIKTINGIEVKKTGVTSEFKVIVSETPSG